MMLRLPIEIILVIVFTAASHVLVNGTASSSDMLFIRHGRSRVRHSNERDHIRWGLQAFDNLTLDYESEGYDNESFIFLGNDMWTGDNGSFVNQTSVLNQTVKNSRSTDDRNVQHMTTLVPSTLVTAIKKKFKKKKIMESIRKNVDKGLKYLKMHKKLEENIRVPDTSQEFGYQNDGSDSVHGDNSKRTRLDDAITTDKGVMSETVVTSRDLRTNKNLPHSIPTRVSVSYKQQVVAREGDSVHPELIEKNENFTNGGSYGSDEERSMPNILNLDSGPNQSGSTSLSAVGDDPGVEDTYDNVVDIEDNDEGIGYTSNDEGDEDGDGIPLNVYGTTDEDLSDLDEISRNNRLNLMKGRDVVTKFLQIVETQHLLGANCSAGTALNLGEGVVDQYAQERFRVEAEVAVNRANMLTRIFKLTSPSVQASEHLLHASVLSMVEFDDDIFAAGNCFDWNQHPAKSGLFCPFAYRLPPPDQGASFAKDLAAEYHYLGNTSEWFFLARKNAEKVIARNEQYIKAYHLYSNSTTREADEILSVKYEDGRWSKPYYDCGGGNIWMLTYTVPFFGYENGSYFFKGTSGIDIDLRRVDIDQCPQRNTPGTTQPLNIFAGTDKCKQRTTMCEAITSLGFRRGSYKCVCRKGFYFPDTTATQKYFNGSILEEEYEKLMLGEDSTYSKPLAYECLPCAEGCDFCEDASPCVAALNWPMRTTILALACAVIGLLPPAGWFTYRYQQVKVVRAASPALLRVIASGAFFIYCTTIVMYPPPSVYTCSARVWLREIGFSLTYGALMLKTWRISVIFRVRSAKAVKITDASLLKRLGVICAVICACLLVRTIVSPPDVVVGRTAEDLKAFLCRTDWWDYTFTTMEVLFLAWGVRLCIMVRKAPSEFNESRFISMAIYNEFLLTCFLNVSMLFLQSPANPDLLYIIFFCHTQLTVTLLLGLIFGSKVYIVMRSGKTQENAIGLGAKASGAKFNFRPQIRTFANPSTATSSTGQLADIKLSDQEALEEIRQLSVQLQRIQELAPPRGIAVMTISSLLDGLKTTSHQLTLKPTTLSVMPLSNDYKNRQSQQKVSPAKGCEKSTITDIAWYDFWESLQSQCSTCSHINKKDDPLHATSCTQQKPLSAQQGSRELSFSELQLDCMCSQPDEPYPVASSTEVHCSSDGISGCNQTIEKSKMADNTTVSCGRSSQKPKFHSACNLIQSNISYVNTYCDNHKSNEHFLICDNCKNKLLNAKSIELNLGSKDPCRLGGLRTKSIDDVSFYSSNESTTINEPSQDRTTNGANSGRSRNMEPNNSDSDYVNGKDSGDGRKLRNRKQDKPVLDLNDRSKYTKEVSV